MKATDRRSDPSDDSSDDTHPRAGGGKTTAALPAGGGRSGGLPFMDVQLKSDEGGSWFDPMQMAKTGTLEVAQMFFQHASTSERVEVIEARRPRYERIALLRSIPRDEMQKVLRKLDDGVQRTLIMGDGIDDLLPPAALAEILNTSGRRNLYAQPKLTLAQMMELMPLLDREVQPMLLLANEAHATPVLNSLDDGDLEAILRGMRTLPVIARRIVDNLPGHLRDRVRKAIDADPSLASLMPVDSSTDADMAKSQTDPEKAWLWDSTFRDEGSKNLPSSEDWAALPAHARLPMFVAATIDKRVAYLSKEPESVGRLLRALDAENKVQTVLAFVKKHPKRRSMLADLKAEDIMPVLADGSVQPSEAATLFLASSYHEQQLLGPVMTPLQVAALFSVDDVETTWIKGWSSVPDTLIAAAFLRMDEDKLSMLLFYAGDSAKTMRKLLPEGHPLKAAPGT